MDSEWQHLEQHAAEVARYDTRYGVCVICGLGATAIDRPVGFGAWCRCVICDTAWRSLVPDLHVAPGGQPDDDDPETTWLEDVRREWCGDDLEDDEWFATLNYHALMEIACAHRFEPANQQSAINNEENMKRQTATTEDSRTVEQIVAAVEALTLDDPGISDAIAHGRASVEALRVAGMAEIFPSSLHPVSDAVLRDFQLALDASNVLPYEPIFPTLAALHARALEGDYLELAQLVRGERGQRLVRLHARRAANPEPDAWERAESTAIAMFVADVSKQLQARGSFLPMSTVLSEGIPALIARLDAVARRHAEHQAAQVRAAEEAEARERAELEAIARAEESKRRAARLASEDHGMRQRREELAAFFRKYPRFRFPIDGAWQSSEECAEAVLEGAVFSDYYRVQSQGQPVRATR